MTFPCTTRRGGGDSATPRALRGTHESGSPAFGPRQYPLALTFLALVLAACTAGTAAPTARAGTLQSATLASADDGAWDSVTVFPVPGVREEPTAVHDPLRARMIVYGGFGGTWIGDVWALCLVEGASPSWTQLFPAGPTPPARRGHAAIYDRRRDRMIVFGGQTATGAVNDVWALSLSTPPTWTELHPSGGPPPARYYHAAVYDSVGDRLLIFGGYDGDRTYLSDVWGLTLAELEWSQIIPGGPVPPARGTIAGVRDPKQ